MPSSHQAMRHTLESGSIRHGGIFGADSKGNLKENVQRREMSKQSEKIVMHKMRA